MDSFPQRHAPDIAAPGTARRHLAYVARAMAEGCDVLDLHGGDGALAAVLAGVARRVTAGLEPQALEAATEAFIGSGAVFVTQAALAASETESGDLVLALGAAPTEPGIAALRRRVRQGGRLLLEAPGGGAPTALTALLAPHFAHVRVLQQAGLIGSVLLGGAGEARVFRHRGATQVEATRGLHPPDGFVVIASDTPLDDVADSVLIDAPLAALHQAQAQARQAAREAAALRAEQTQLATALQDHRAADADWRHRLAVLRVSEARAQTRLAALEAERDGLTAALAALATPASAPAPAPALADAPVVPPPPPALRLATRLRRLLPRGGARAKAVTASRAFDAAWYRATYPDVAAAGLDPARHYLRHGAREGRNPGPDFDAAFYAAAHADLAATGLSAVEHYERHGRAAGWPTAAPAAPPTPAARPNPKILFVAGEPDTPGAQYRCQRMADAARAAGWDAGTSRIERTGAIELIGVEIVVLWRVRYSPHVAGIIAEMRQQNGTVVFDTDDLMIRPELANTRTIDGIRTTNAGIASTRETFAQVQQAMLHADLCTTTTEALARHMRDWQKATYVLPNGFDAATHARSRLAVRRRALAPDDGLIRIGYAAGTVTHQRDFAVCLPALTRVMAARPAVRLVLFRAGGDTELVVVDEFEALAAYADRIEWREKVPLEALPDELARFDINLAPLEAGNPFCEAKSELKYFEAALVDVPTVATPTEPFAAAIRHGDTGLLAATEPAWHEALLRLVDDAGFRAAMGRRAYLACLWPFGPERRAALVDGFLHQVKGSEAGARAFALEVHAARIARTLPALPPAETLFHADRLGQALVTVIVPCFNYADFVIETLESVRAQTLESLDLVVVDDCSTDPLATELIEQWVRTHAARFNRVVVRRHLDNAGLSAARNSGFDAAETPFVLPLDADNRLLPECCARLAATLTASRAAYAYGSVRMFGAADAVFCNERYQPVRFIGGNYIDAMAMIAKPAWAQAGGYDMPRSMGWEDFDLWCTLAELGQRGVHVAEVLAEYRVHGGSMIANTVEVAENKEKMVAEIERRHDWLRLSSRTKHERI